MGNALSAAYSAMPLRGVIPTPPARRTAGRVSCSTKSPIGPKTLTSSLGWRAAKARLYGESERRTAYSRCGRVGLVASDIGRASMPSSVLSWRKVNCVARNAKVSGFSSWIAWVVGVSGREDKTRTRKPLGGPSNVVTSNLHWPRPPRPYFVTSALGRRHIASQGRITTLIESRASATSRNPSAALPNGRTCVIRSETASRFSRSKLIDSRMSRGLPPYEDIIVTSSRHTAPEDEQGASRPEAREPLPADDTGEGLDEGALVIRDFPRERKHPVLDVDRGHADVLGEAARIEAGRPQRVAHGLMARPTVAA